MKKTSRILALVMVFAMLLSVSAFASGEPAAPGVESIKDMTASSYTTLDAVNTRSQDLGYIYVGYDVVDGQLTEESNWTAGDYNNIVLDNEVEGAGFTAVHASGEMTNVTVTGDLVLYNGADDAQGEHASDFTGAGAAFVAADSGKLTIKDVNLTTDGFVRAGAIVDHGAQVWIEDSTFVTYGADPLTEAYDGYVNSATTSKMLSPPWVLGIQGGIRTINVLDTNATLTVVNSTLVSGGWGVISTDGCTQPKLTIIDSNVGILPESKGGMTSGWQLFGYDEDAYGTGYSAYLIGNCDEQYYGSTIYGGTFGAIAREGSVVYQSSKGDIETFAATGESLGTVAGKGNVTTINTVFGVMSHSSEDVNISYLDGTVVNTAESTVLYRSSGHGNFTFDNAVLLPGDGIIVQMIDDDDSTVGMGDFSTMGFNTELIEAAGMPSQSGSLTGPTNNNEEVNAVFTNGAYEGNLYNGTGYYGQAGDVLNVTVGEGATLSGTISLTETFHGIPYSAAAKAVADTLDGVEYVFIDGNFNVTANEAEAAYIQFTHFTIDQYYLLCRMQNHVYNNGYSGANVTVTDGGVWKVTGEGIISSLTIDGGTVIGELVENADGSLTLLPGTEAIPAGTYGTVVVANVAASMGMGNVGGSAEPEGINAGATAVGAASEEPAASQEPAAAGADTSVEAYHEYLHQWLIAEDEVNANMDESIRENEFMPLIYAGDYVSFPAEMLWNGMLENGCPMTYDEFVAAGGVYTIP